MAAAHRGWINILAAVDPDDVPRQRVGIFTWLNGRVPPIALGTWIAPKLKDDVVQPASVGLQQPDGHKTLPLLRERGLVPPDGWRLTHDAARRGLVVTAPLDAPSSEILEWLTTVTAALTPAPTSDRWIAQIYPGR